MVGRLRPGAGTDQARLELNSIAQTPLPEFPRPPHASMDPGLIVNSLQDDVTGGVKPALLAVLGAVVLVLVIACANVTNLLLARGAQRRGEFAMRVALGAGRTRMIRQLLTESLLLAVLGGALGMVVAELGVRALVALSPPGLPRVGAIRIDGAVFAFALGITTLIGLVVGLIPALHASRRDLHIGLQQSSHAHRRRSPMAAPNAGRGRSRARPRVAGERGLAVAQPAASVRDRSWVRYVATCSRCRCRRLGRRFDDDTTHHFFRASSGGGTPGPGRHRGRVHQPVAAERRP